MVKPVPPPNPVGGSGSTESASCCNRTIAFPAYARAHSSASGLTASQWPDTDCVAFATSATVGWWVWRHVLGIGEIFDILFSQPHLTLSFCAFACYDVDVITLLFVTDSVRVL
jgi:hypothetical protein